MWSVPLSRVARYVQLLPPSRLVDSAMRRRSTTLYARTSTLCGPDAGQLLPRATAGTKDTSDGLDAAPSTVDRDAGSQLFPPSWLQD